MGKKYKKWDETDVNLLEARIRWSDTGYISPEAVREVAEMTGRSYQAVMKQVNRLGYAVRREIR